MDNNTAYDVDMIYENLIRLYNHADLFEKLNLQYVLQTRGEKEISLKNAIVVICGNVKNYWNLYVENHSKIKIESNKSDFYKKLLEIYNRTILLFPLLINDETGGIVAALELDENRTKSGCYAYCWPRDSIFITRAFDLLKMEEETEKFYNVFCKKTQSNN